MTENNKNHEAPNAPAIIDLEALWRDVEGAKLITSDAASAAVIDRAMALAVIDAAASLRELAAYVNLVTPRAAVPANEVLDNYDPNEVVGPTLAVGDEVNVTGVSRVTATLVEVKESEGRLYGVVRWPNGEVNKAWLDTLTRATPDAEPKPKKKGKKKGRDSE